MCIAGVHCKGWRGTLTPLLFPLLTQRIDSVCMPRMVQRVPINTKLEPVQHRIHLLLQPPPHYTTRFRQLNCSILSSFFANSANFLSLAIPCCKSPPFTWQFSFRWLPQIFFSLFHLAQTGSSPSTSSRGKVCGKIEPRKVENRKHYPQQTRGEPLLGWCWCRDELRRSHVNIDEPYVFRFPSLDLGVELQPWQLCPSSVQKSAPKLWPTLKKNWNLFPEKKVKLHSTTDKKMNRVLQETRSNFTTNTPDRVSLTESCPCCPTTPNSSSNFARLGDCRLEKIVCSPLVPVRKTVGGGGGGQRSDRSRNTYNRVLCYTHTRVLRWYWWAGWTHFTNT